MSPPATARLQGPTRQRVTRGSRATPADRTTTQCCSGSWRPSARAWANARQCRPRRAVDSSPVLEKACAVAAGIGWRGRNTLVLNERLGSYFVLGLLLADTELPFDTPATDRCGSCWRCIDACPTSALRAPGMLDARRCVSYHNSCVSGVRSARGDCTAGSSAATSARRPARSTPRLQALPAELQARPAFPHRLDAVLAMDEQALRGEPSGGSALSHGDIHRSRTSCAPRRWKPVLAPPGPLIHRRAARERPAAQKATATTICRRNTRSAAASRALRVRRSRRKLCPRLGVARCSDEHCLGALHGDALCIASAACNPRASRSAAPSRDPAPPSRMRRQAASLRSSSSEAACKRASWKPAVPVASNSDRGGEGHTTEAICCTSLHLLSRCRPRPSV